jgi:tRNAThr (cytosine32-N3)-methyltransferase
MQRRLLYSRQSDPLYISPEIGSVHASVWDVTSPEGLPQDVHPGTVDIVILVFVLSALHPDEWGQAINNIQKVSRSILQIRSGLNLAS